MIKAIHKHSNIDIRQFFESRFWKKKTYAEPKIGRKEGFWRDLSSEINYFMVLNMFKHTFDHILTCRNSQKPSK